MTDRPAPPPLPMAAHGHQILAHRTVLPAEPAAAVAALEAAWASADRRDALSRVCATYPASLDAWGRLSQAAYAAQADVDAYAFARVGYHRGLDRLRRHGWGGTGQVHWADATNRGFLRALHALMCAAAALGEMDEAERCGAFLLDLDPEDGVGAGRRPQLAAHQRIPVTELP
ncbi:MAG TPA: DUF3151 family protein [Verrucomicrobiae bacterium]|nr:DUF3151 family protein [Verrucomicrobiae bacterium]